MFTRGFNRGQTHRAAWLGDGPRAAPAAPSLRFPSGTAASIASGRTPVVSNKPPIAQSAPDPSSRIHRRGRTRSHKTRRRNRASSSGAGRRDCTARNTPGFATPIADGSLRHQQRRAQSPAGVAGSKPGGRLTVCSRQLLLFPALERGRTWASVDGPRVRWICSSWAWNRK